MDINIKEISAVTHEIEIAVSQQEIEPHFKKAYEQYRKNIEMRGFRKGKAPLDMVKKIYGDLIEHEALEGIASDYFKQAAKEKELNPIGEPALVDMNFKKGENFWFKIRFEVRPKIELKEYKNLQIEKPIHTVTNADVEQELTRLRRTYSTLEEVDAVSDINHMVTVDLQDLDESGMPLIGKKSSDIRFYLADERLEAPFKESLKEAKKGGTYKVQFEHEHDDHKHTVNTEITVKKVEKVNLPALDDEFAAKVTRDKVKSIKQLESDIRKDLDVYWKQQSERQVVNSLTAEIIKRHDFPVPESLIRNVLERLLEETKNDYPQKQLPPDFDVNKFNETNREYAVYQCKWALLREELVKAENITAEDSDLEKLAEEDSEKLKIPKERLMNYYKDAEHIKDRIIGDKLIKVLVNLANIKEVSDKK